MKKIANGQLYVISAPSGTGKTSLVNRICRSEQINNICVSISHTTREKRATEQHGINYFFIDNNTFEKMIQKQELLEYAKVFDHYYGTSSYFVNTQLAKGIDVILEIDWQGAQQVKKNKPEVITIFILPPSQEILLERLQKRGTEHPKNIQQRFQQASQDIRHYTEFDYLIINHQFDSALNDLSSIICSHRLKQQKQQIRHATLIKNLWY